MSRRDQIRMSDAEIEQFLDDGRDLHIATIGPDGAPHMVTMWYGLLDGRIVFWTYGKSQKIRNLQRDPRITALLSDGDAYGELRGISIRGKGRIVEDPDAVADIGEAVYARNARRFGDVRAGDGRFEFDDDTRAVVRQMGAKRFGVVLEPDSIVSWDHRKLGGVY